MLYAYSHRINAIALTICGFSSVRPDWNIVRGSIIT